MAGCSFNFELTSQRTALENQIMGSYKEIDDDLIVTSFENGSATDGNKSQSSGKDNAALQRAIRNRAFNADDIVELKDIAILGEFSDGQLRILPKGFGSVESATPQQVRLAEALIDEENRDRAVIWANELAKIQDAKPTDMAAIKEAFARQIYEGSVKGHWFHVGGKWAPKT
jgi:hypothetical protein